MDEASCPIAIACNRQTGKKYRVSGDFISEGDRFHRMDQDALLWIKAFDTGRPVKPFTLGINAFTVYIQPSAREQ